MSDPAAPDFIRYLAAKKGLDDRSLNRQVWESPGRRRCAPGRPRPLRVLEVGCGIGTMLERLLDRGLLTRAAYTGIDVEPGMHPGGRPAPARLCGGAPVPLTVEPGGALRFATPAQDVRVTFEAADLFDFLDREQEKAAWDLLVAHAVLDLDRSDHRPAPLLVAAWLPAGCSTFTLNFDGATILEPPIDPDLDALIETLYHRTMDTRRGQGPALGQQPHRPPALRAASKRRAPG